MLTLKLANQSVCRVVSLGVCSTSQKQVFGISVQRDSLICRIMAIFGLPWKNLPNGIQPKVILNVVGYPKMLSNLHIHNDVFRVTGLGDVLIWESINHKYVDECLIMTGLWYLGDSSYHNSKLSFPRLRGLPAYFHEY